MVSIGLVTLEVLRHGGDHEEDLDVAIRDFEPQRPGGGGGHHQGVILVVSNIAIHHNYSC